MTLEVRELAMSDSDQYVPSPWDWVSQQVEEYVPSGGTRANTLLDTRCPSS